MTTNNPTELEQLITWGTAPAPVQGAEKNLHQLFEERAVTCPQTLAVACEEQQLTYEDLNRRANRLAHRLRSMGVGPEVVVGIYAGRSLHIMVGMLGILKA